MAKRLKNKQSKEIESLKEDMLAMQQMIKEQSINAESIAKFIINHMFVPVACVNSNSSSCISCPYRFDCKYCDYNVDVVSVVLCES